MPLLTLITGLLLVVLGASVTYRSYLETNAMHYTALIPAAFGVVLLILGGVGLLGGNARKHAMHGAAAVSLLGVVGGAFMPIKAMMAGTFVPESTKGIGQLTMIVLCAALLALCVNSFVQARLLRKADAPPPA